MVSEIIEMFHAFGLQLNTSTAAGILLEYFRRKVLKFQWSKTVSHSKHRLGFERTESASMSCTMQKSYLYVSDFPSFQTLKQTQQEARLARIDVVRMAQFVLKVVTFNN